MQAGKRYATTLAERRCWSRNARLTCGTTSWKQLSTFFTKYANSWKANNATCSSLGSVSENVAAQFGSAERSNEVLRKMRVGAGALVLEPWALLKRNKKETEESWSPFEGARNVFRGP